MRLPSDIQVACHGLGRGVKITQSPFEDTEHHTVVDARIVMDDEVTELGHID